MKTNLGIRLDMGHLKDVGMGYFEHLIGAYKLAFRFLLGTVQLLIHGLIPNLFVDAGKKRIGYLQAMNAFIPHYQ